jgi:tRNA (guanine-N7-)-methyltransferase
MSVDNDSPAPMRRAIRSFVVRGGRLTEAQQRARERLWPRFSAALSDQPLDLAAVFGRNAPCVLEIGFGNGEHLAQQAAKNPDKNFLGIEVHPPGVGHLLLRAEQLNLTNLRIIEHDAVEVLGVHLAEESLDEVLILFPDPWHKKKHHKRRLINATFTELVTSRLRVGGLLRLATDWEHYAEWMLEVLNAAPNLRNCADGGAYMPRDANRAATRFEQRGERLGHAVFDLLYERTSLKTGYDSVEPEPHLPP